MSKIKRWIAAFFLGQFLALWKRDRTFKSKVQSASGRQKLKVAFEGMFNFNKRLVIESKDTDIQGNFKELRTFILDEKDRLTTEIEELKTTLPAITKEKATEIFDRLHDEVNTVKERLLSFTHDVDEKYHLSSLIEKLSTEIKDIGALLGSSKTGASKPTKK